MKSLLITAIGCALLGSVGGAVAADLPYRVAPAPALYPPVPSWTGFYVGANGGWQWSKADVTFDPFGGSSLFDFGSQTISRQTTGAVFGGQAGYNWQLSPTWVVGIEGDVDGSGAATSRNVVTPSGLAITGSDGFGASNRLEWLNSVRGRLGYVWGSGLLYFTGGGAWASFRHDAILSTNGGDCSRILPRAASLALSQASLSVGAMSGWSPIIGRSEENTSTITSRTATITR